MKLRPFELALVIIFGILMVLAIILLRNVTPEQKEEEVSFGESVLIWGTLPSNQIDTIIYELSATNPNYKKVSYRYVSEKDFDQVFINALADGKSPDLLLIPHELLVKHRTRIEAFSYESFPVRDFRSMYIDGAEIFARNDGIYGFPIAVDPLMLYWNRDIFSNKNLLSAPTTWEGIVGEIVPQLTERDSNRTIKLSALAFGEAKNIKNAFPIISMLLLQGGSQLVVEANKSYRVRLDEVVGSISGRPFTNAMTFFTNFSNVSNTLYSWNRSLPEDKEMFLRENLAMYFGFASEGKDLEMKNPNLNFDISLVPQGADSTVKRTYGKFYSLMIPRTAPNKTGAYTVMQEFGGQTLAKRIADSYGLAPVHRSSLVVGSNDVYGRVAYLAAPLARAWLNPDISKSNDILVKLLEAVAANRSDISSAVSDAVKKLELAY